MKLYNLHMILQDIRGGNAFGNAYSISCESTPSFRKVMDTIKMHLNSEDHVCCSAYITEREDNVEKLMYAKNYVSITGRYYPGLQERE